VHRGPWERLRAASSPRRRLFDVYAQLVSRAAHLRGSPRHKVDAMARSAPEKDDRLLHLGIGAREGSGFFALGSGTSMVYKCRANFAGKTSSSRAGDIFCVNLFLYVDYFGRVNLHGRTPALVERAVVARDC